MAELIESSLYLKQEKEENLKVISELVKIEEGMEKKDLLMEIDALVEELVSEEKDLYLDLSLLRILLAYLPTTPCTCKW